MVAVSFNLSLSPAIAYSRSSDVIINSQLSSHSIFQKEASETAVISPFFAWLPTLVFIAIASFIKGCSEETGRKTGGAIGNVLYP